MLHRLLMWVFYRLVNWPLCPDCKGPADLFEGHCVPCFRARLLPVEED